MKGRSRSLLVLVLLLSASQVVARTIDFDKDPVGASPDGWTCGVTGRGTPKWSVEIAADSPSKSQVLRQSGQGTFPWCVRKDVAITDGFVEVKFKPARGEGDRAGGVVWRWKDGDNYYVARANALENNVSLYHTTHGSRQTIEYASAPVQSNVWHTLRAEFSGKQIKVILDGKLVIEQSDTHIAGTGAVGVWTKADSVTEFDDFSWDGK